MNLKFTNLTTTGISFFRDGEEWKRIRQTIAPKVMRPKIVEENIDNFNAVSDDAIARFVKLKEACEPDDDIPDLEGEVNRFTTESKFQLSQSPSSVL